MLGQSDNSLCERGGIPAEAGIPPEEHLRREAELDHLRGAVVDALVGELNVEVAHGRNEDVGIAHGRGASRTERSDDEGDDQGHRESEDGPGHVVSPYTGFFKETISQSCRCASDGDSTRDTPPVCQPCQIILSTKLALLFDGVNTPATTLLITQILLYKARITLKNRWIGRLNS